MQLCGYMGCLHVDIQTDTTENITFPQITNAGSENRKARRLIIVKEMLIVDNAAFKYLLWHIHTDTDTESDMKIGTNQRSH